MRYPPFLTMLQELIASPSVSSVSPEWDHSNEGVIDSLASWYESAGFRVEKQVLPESRGKYNLVATIGSGPDGLVLAGHTDTVPCDPGLWRSDPFRLEEREQRLFGLGTSDMKGFFAVVLEALRELDLGRLKCPLVILATADEESSMNGAKALVRAERRLGKHAVIGEPTGLKPVRLHKGIGMDAVRVLGQSGHSSDPSLGNSALDGMHRVIAEIIAWRDQLQRRYQNRLFAVPGPTLNLGHIHGGDNPNRICGQCDLYFDLRPLPGMDLATLRAELDARLTSIAAASGLTIERRSLFDGVPAMETDATATIVQATEQLTGYAAGAVAFATEGPYLNSLGMQTVVLGPGDIEQAHQPDEFLALDRIDPAVDIMRNLIKRFCVA